MPTHWLGAAAGGSCGAAFGVRRWAPALARRPTCAPGVPRKQPNCPSPLPRPPQHAPLLPTRFAGSLLSEAAPVLVLPDAHAAAAAELCQLQAEEAAGRVPPGSTAATVRLVAMVLHYLRQLQAAEAAGAGSPAATAVATAYPPAAAMRLAAVACHLVSTAVAARWPHLAALVLPAVTAGGCPAAAAAHQMAGLVAPARTPLHLALASGSAASVAVLRGWAGRHGVDWVAAGQPAAGGEGAASASASQQPLGALLLLAAAMGSSMGPDMVQQLTGERLRGRPGGASEGGLGLGGLLPAAGMCSSGAPEAAAGWACGSSCNRTHSSLPPAALPAEMLGQERLAAAADVAGPCGWSPRRVAQATDNAALLAALPPEPATTSAAATGAAAAAAEEGGKWQQWEEPESAAEAEEWAQLRACPEKLAALEAEWEAAAAAGGKGWPARRRRQAQPSHDATLLASLMEELQVPAEEGRQAAGASRAARPERRGRASLVAQLLKTSLAGATAAVVAALAAVAVRTSWLEAA